MRDARAAHGLRRSELPEHRRVLAPRHRHVHDPRRHLHPLVRLLQRHARHAEAAGRARAGQGRERHPRDGAGATSSSRRSIATTSPTAARRISRSTITETRARIPSCRIEVLIPDFKGDEAALRTVLDARPGRAQPQHRDRAAPVPHRAAGRPLRSRARSPRSLAHLRAADPDQVRADGRPGRRMGRSRRRRLRDLRAAGLPDRHHRSVPAALAREPADGRATTRPPSSPS